MESEIRIEEIDASRIDSALGLLERFFTEEGFRAAGGDLRAPLTEMIADPNSVVLLCSRAGEPIGVATITTSIGLEYGRSAEIEDLYVKPGARGQGIATALIDRALEWCRGRGCSAALVTIAAGGPPGEKLTDFYLRRGFQENGRRLMEYGIRGRAPDIRREPRLQLRDPRAADLDQIALLWVDELVTRHIGGPRDLGKVLDHFREYSTDPPAFNAREREWWWSIIERETGDFVGLSSLMVKEVAGKDELELGYFLLPQFWGKGYASEASRLVLDFAFTNLEAESVIALIDRENEASARVARALGMRLEGEVARTEYVQRVFRLRRPWMLKVVAFDLDDTLVQNEAHYRKAKREFEGILSRYQRGDRIRGRLDEIEVENILRYGYGVKSFMLSMVEAALELSDERIAGGDMSRVLEIGKAMLVKEVELLDGTVDVLEKISKGRDLMIITKGDRFEQRRKIDRSGISGYFRYVEILSEKTPEAYRGILERHGLAPADFLMVGNSLRSDVMPVLSIGARAVYVPDEQPWFHELPSDGEAESLEYVELDRLGELPAHIAQIEWK
jgi:putative hydrolase of the HAD superfamily